MYFLSFFHLFWFTHTHQNFRAIRDTKATTVSNPFLAQVGPGPFNKVLQSFQHNGISVDLKQQMRPALKIKAKVYLFVRHPVRQALSRGTVKEIRQGEQDTRR